MVSEFFRETIEFHVTLFGQLALLSRRVDGARDDRVIDVEHVEAADCSRVNAEALQEGELLCRLIVGVDKTSHFRIS